MAHCPKEKAQGQEKMSPKHLRIERRPCKRASKSEKRVLQKSSQRMGPAKGLQISFSKIWALQKGFQKMYRSLKTRLDCHKGKQHSPREKNDPS